MPKGARYPECEHLRSERASIVISKELQESLLQQDYSVLPLYEKKVMDYVASRSSSLHTNRKLACCWQSYQNQVTSGRGDREPLRFPDVSDFHFYSSKLVYDPSLSMSGRKSFRYSMRPGPGIDEHHTLPIPNQGYEFRLRPKPPKLPLKAAKHSKVVKEKSLNEK